MRTGLYLGEVPIGKVIVAVAGENGIQLQEKTVTPSKGSPIEVTPDIGIDGLSKVTVEPIPDAYINTTTNNAPYAGDMLKGTIAFANTKKIEGELEDKDILEYSADGLSFKDGDLIISGTNTKRAIIKAEADVSITVEGTDLGNATAADVLNGKTFTSENGLVVKGTGPTLENLNVTKADVLAGKKFIGPNGIEETGDMANNGSITAILDSTTTYKDIPTGYTTGGKVSLGTNVVDTTISSNEAQAAHILSGKKAYANGGLITGGMTDNSSNTTAITLSGTKTSHTIPKGYHSGSQKVQISVDSTNNSAAPSSSGRTYYPSSNKVFTSFTVSAMPAATTETWTLTDINGNTSTLKVVTG